MAATLIVAVAWRCCVRVCTMHFASCMGTERCCSCCGLTFVAHTLSRMSHLITNVLCCTIKLTCYEHVKTRDHVLVTEPYVTVLDITVYAYSTVRCV